MISPDDGNAARASASRSASDRPQLGRCLKALALLTEDAKERVRHLRREASPVIDDLATRA